MVRAHAYGHGQLRLSAADVAAAAAAASVTLSLSEALAPLSHRRRKQQMSRRSKRGSTHHSNLRCRNLLKLQLGEKCLQLLLQLHCRRLRVAVCGLELHSRMQTIVAAGAAVAADDDTAAGGNDDDDEWQRCCCGWPNLRLLQRRLPAQNRGRWRNALLLLMPLLLLLLLPAHVCVRLSLC